MAEAAPTAPDPPPSHAAELPDVLRIFLAAHDSSDEAMSITSCDGAILYANRAAAAALARAPEELIGRSVLELEPGRAFGTGLHATTSLVAQALDAREPELRGKELLDVGCGSGILALVALVLGAGKARGIDIDEAAARVANENAQRTGLAERFFADTTDVTAIEGRWPIVLANIQAEVLVALRPALAARVAPGGLLVLSGVLEMHEREVTEAFSAFTLEEATRKGEWVCLVLRA